MKLLIKKIYFIFFFFAILLFNLKTLAKDSEIQYSKENISNYFQGKISINHNYNNKAFNSLKKVRSLKKYHSQFNVEFIRTLVLLEKFKEAIDFSKTVWKEEDLFFETDLLLGLSYFINEDYETAEKYFKRLNKISRYNLIFDNFIGNILISWNEAAQGNKDESFKSLSKIPNLYNHLRQTQNIFLQCYFNDSKTQETLENLIGSKDYNFSRYNFFLVNYLLFKNKKIEAKKVVSKSREKYTSNLLIKQMDFFLENNESEKIKNFFNCNNPKDALAEFFYVLANLYSSEEDYRLSNFYLKISFFLNNKFLTNKALLAENYYYQKRIKDSKNIYTSLKSISPIYSWYSSKNIATILEIQKGKKESIKNLEKDFNLLENKNFEHYYEMANIYKDNQYHKESIKYYSLALEKIKKNHSLIPKILDRRGTSFERINDWENAEKDLIESLRILPDQAHVLNYLAYTWVDQGVKLDKALEMLKKANELKENDGYIIDSLGWAYYAKKDYVEADIYLQRAVELLPHDPVINDHYGDNLWMLNKNIQARYVWKNILKLDNTEKELKDTIKKKLILGIATQL